LDQTTTRTVEKIRFEEDRPIKIRLEGKPVDVVNVQVCMPMTDHIDEEVDAVYERIEELLDKETSSKVYTLVMRYWNSNSNILNNKGLEATYRLLKQ